MSSTLLFLSLLSLFALSSQLQTEVASIPFGDSEKYDGELIRGVNIGGWLVLEPWITPSLFAQFEDLPEDQQAVDEWTFCEKLGYDNARVQLIQHWETWVTYEELRTLALADITHIRIPVGYWIVDIQEGEPWVDGGMPYLERAIGWAGQLGLKVLIDLHGAPGSQNGFDNSGKRGPADWGFNETYIERTTVVVNTLASKFDTEEYRGVVTGIELVNEPVWYMDIDTLKTYYLYTYDLIRGLSTDSVWDFTINFHDSFRWDEWYGFMQPPEYQNVILDTHIYQVFDYGLLLEDWDEHIATACSYKSQVQNSQANLWTVVGEWCLATTDCTKWLNGFGVGARYDGTMDGYDYIGSCAGRTDISNTTVFTDDYKNFLNEFFEYQYDAFTAGSGFYFWTFKAEQSPQWSYLQGLAEGWIPSDLDSITRSCDDFLAKREAKMAAKM